MEDNEPIADQATVLAGENTVIIKSGDGRIGVCDVVVNGQKQSFDTDTEITVSDAQLDVLRNSGRNVEEVKVSAATKKADKVSPSEAGGEEGSKSPAAGGKTAAKKSAIKKNDNPTSNVTDGGNTTTSSTLKLTN